MPTAAKTKLKPGEDSVDRVADALPPRGPYERDVSVRLWNGKLRRVKIRARTKGEFRNKGHRKVDELLTHGTSEWKNSAPITDFIEQVAQTVVTNSKLRTNTRVRYSLALRQLTTQLKGFTIIDATRFRTLETALQTIGARHGAESARQARTVLSKYVLDQLIREGLIDHNPLRGIAIDLGSLNKASRTTGRHALSDAQYDLIIEHLLARDVTAPMPPGTDRKRSSIAKHANTVALTLLQAGTGLRLSEVLSLTTADVTVTDILSVTVSADVSKTHRARSIPLLDERVENYWRARLTTLPGGTVPLVPAPGDPTNRWRTDNAVKACAALYEDMGAVLDDPTIATMRSHAWRTTLNNRGIARGVPAEVRAAYFGHDPAMNAASYTDLTDVSAMSRALMRRPEDVALEVALEP